MVNRPRQKGTCAIMTGCANVYPTPANAVKSMGFVPNVLIATHKVFNSIITLGSEAIKKATSRAFTALIRRNIGFRGIIKVNRGIRLYVIKLKQFIVVYMAIDRAKAGELNDRGNYKVKVIQTVVMSREKIKELFLCNRVFRFKSNMDGFKMRENENAACYRQINALFHIGLVWVVSKLREMDQRWQWLIHALKPNSVQKLNSPHTLLSSE